MSLATKLIITILIIYSLVATSRWCRWYQATLDWQVLYVRLQHKEDDAIQRIAELVKENQVPR